MRYRTLFEIGGLRREMDYGLVEFGVDQWTSASDAVEKGLQGRAVQFVTLTSQRQGRDTSESSAMGYAFAFGGREYRPSKGRGWTTTHIGMQRLGCARRISESGNGIRLKRYLEDSAGQVLTDFWDDIGAGAGRDKTYVVQTGANVLQRCLLMTTDPGDLVLDPTCGSGTTAYVAEQWGRRWITVDTSRVALALARARLMGGRQKEADVSGRAYVAKATFGNLKHGFVYERVPHITLKSIANNTEIDVLYDEHQPAVLVALADLNAALRGHKTPFKVATGGRAGKSVDFTVPEEARFTMPSGEEVSASDLVEWEVPREAPSDWPPAAAPALERFWNARIARQQAIDASIAAKAEYEYLYDKPYEDTKTVRVAGPFTVESLSPHRVLGVDEDDRLIDPLEVAESAPDYRPVQSFDQMILEQLRVAGVQQAHKEDRIGFTALTGWAGRAICAEATYQEADAERRAGIFIGPEFGTVTRVDLVEAAREAGEAGFDVVIACAFNYDAQATEFASLGAVRVLKARMNADLHMAEDLKSTGKGNLFVIFGEPDIDLETVDGDRLRVTINGESFFVRHAYFLGAGDPYKSLKTTLKAEIDEDAWATLNSAVSRPFPRPTGGRIAVKVINHLGDEVMKVLRV